MHDIEQQIIGFLQNGQQPSLWSIGGFQKLYNCSNELYGSRLLPEILMMLCREVNDTWEADWRHFVVMALRHADDSPTTNECVDILDNHPTIVGAFANQLFDVYRTRAADESTDPLLRTSFLDGCIRLTIKDSKKRFDFLSFLMQVDGKSLGAFAKRFIKIVGVCNCHWSYDELHKILVGALSDESCVDEANFELGMHHFRKLLDTGSIESTNELLKAESYFRIACEFASIHAEATLYRNACRMLRDFTQGDLSNSSQLIVHEIRESLTALRAYHRSGDDPSWLGARTTEIARWESLERKLRSLDHEINYEGWFDARDVIESLLIPVFCASRSLLKRGDAGGVEFLIQPRLIGTIAANKSHFSNLQEWLRRNPSSPIAAEVLSLITSTESELNTSNSSLVAISKITRTNLHGILDQLSPGDDAKQILSQVIEDTILLQTRNLNHVQDRIITQCIEGLGSHPDYKHPDVRVVFNATLWWLVRFIASRLDSMKGDAPEIEYLFRRDDGTRAKEDKLQNDFMTLFRPYAVGSQIEVTNIGGGRADVMLQYNAEKMVVEVKREDRDCSFDAIEERYAEQTFQYQNTASRMGFLLVLDQTDRGGQALHLADSIRPMKLTPKGETEPRYVVVCRISGDRCTPSDLSKPKKKGQRK